MPGKECFITFIQELTAQKVSKQLQMSLTTNKDQKDKLISDDNNPENFDLEVSSLGTDTTYTKNVNNTTYYTVVFGLFTFQAVSAIFVDDPTLVRDILKF